MQPDPAGVSMIEVLDSLDEIEIALLDTEISLDTRREYLKTLSDIDWTVRTMYNMIPADSMKWLMTLEDRNRELVYATPIPYDFLLTLSSLIIAISTHSILQSYSEALGIAWPVVLMPMLIGASGFLFFGEEFLQRLASDEDVFESAVKSGRLPVVSSFAYTVPDVFYGENRVSDIESDLGHIADTRHMINDKLANLLNGDELWDDSVKQFAAALKRNQEAAIALNNAREKRAEDTNSSEETEISTYSPPTQRRDTRA